MKIKFLFAWYDMWVGAFWDKSKRYLYIFPIPCFGVVLQFKAKTNHIPKTTFFYGIRRFKEWRDW